MKLTESQIRSLTREILKELFTKKSGIGLTSFIPGKDQKVDIYSYGGGDGYDFGEAEEKLEEEEVEEAEEKEEK